jgi:hypothetical protein
MLLLAAAAACLAASGLGRAHRRLALLSAGTAVALAGSGTAYLLLSAGAGWTVYVSGPLLLVWVPTVGLWASRRPASQRMR